MRELFKHIISCIIVRILTITLTLTMLLITTGRVIIGLPGCIIIERAVNYKRTSEREGIFGRVVFFGSAVWHDAPRESGIH